MCGSSPSARPVFTVTNGGEQLHNLHIEGPGVSAAAGDPIPAKSSRDVNATLQTISEKLDVLAAPQAAATPTE